MDPLLLDVVGGDPGVGVHGDVLDSKAVASRSPLGGCLGLLLALEKLLTALEKLLMALSSSRTELSLFTADLSSFTTELVLIHD